MDSNSRPLSSYKLSDFQEYPELPVWNKIVLRRLKEHDTSRLKVPSWESKPLPKFLSEIGYHQFVKRVDALANGEGVGKMDMEAGWIQKLIEKYEAYDPRPADWNALQNTTFEACMEGKKELLRRGFFMVSVLSLC